MRCAAAEDRDADDRAFAASALFRGGDDPERHSDRESEQQATGVELDCQGEATHDRVADRLARQHRPAQVSVEHVAQPREVLDVNRVVEVVLLAQRLDHRGVGRMTLQNYGNYATGNKRGEQEYGDRDEQRHGDQQEKPAADVKQQSPPSHPSTIANFVECPRRTPCAWGIMSSFGALPTQLVWIASTKLWLQLKALMEPTFQPFFTTTVLSCQRIGMIGTCCEANCWICMSRFAALTGSVSTSACDTNESICESLRFEELLPFYDGLVAREIEPRQLSGVGNVRQVADDLNPQVRTVVEDDLETWPAWHQVQLQIDADLRPRRLDRLRDQLGGGAFLGHVEGRRETVGDR